MGSIDGLRMELKHDIALVDAHFGEFGQGGADAIRPDLRHPRGWSAMG